MSGYTIECTGETDWMEAHIDVEPMAGDGWNEPRAGGGVTCEAIRFRLDRNRYTRWFNPGEMPDDLFRAAENAYHADVKSSYEEAVEESARHERMERRGL